jgi:hypothetical protein
MKSIKGVLVDICEMAYQQGLRDFGITSSYLRSVNDPRMKPGAFYNSLSPEIKERIKNELKSEDANFFTTRDFIF